MLPESQRLRSRRDFRLVYSRGRSFVNPLIALHVRRTGGDACRVGFSVSKKLGDAVRRNRIKRRLREAVRERAAKLQPGFDVVLVGRAPLRETGFGEIRQAVNELFARAKLVDDAAPPETRE